MPALAARNLVENGTFSHLMMDWHACLGSESPSFGKPHDLLRLRNGAGGKGCVLQTVGNVAKGDTVTASAIIQASTRGDVSIAVAIGSQMRASADADARADVVARVERFHSGDGAERRLSVCCKATHGGTVTVFLYNRSTAHAAIFKDCQCTVDPGSVHAAVAAEGLAASCRELHTLVLEADVRRTLDAAAAAQAATAAPHAPEYGAVARATEALAQDAVRHNADVPSDLLAHVSSLERMPGASLSSLKQALEDLLGALTQDDSRPPTDSVVSGIEQAIDQLQDATVAEHIKHREARAQDRPDRGRIRGCIDALLAFGCQEVDLYVELVQRLREHGRECAESSTVVDAVLYAPHIDAIVAESAAANAEMDVAMARIRDRSAKLGKDRHMCAANHQGKILACDSSIAAAKAEIERLEALLVRQRELLASAMNAKAEETAQQVEHAIQHACYKKALDAADVAVAAGSKELLKRKAFASDLRTIAEHVVQTHRDACQDCGMAVVGRLQAVAERAAKTYGAVFKFISVEVIRALSSRERHSKEIVALRKEIEDRRYHYEDDTAEQARLEVIEPLHADLTARVTHLMGLYKDGIAKWHASIAANVPSTTTFTLPDMEYFPDLQRRAPDVIMQRFPRGLPEEFATCAAQDFEALPPATE